MSAPIGFEAAKADWNELFAGRPYSLDDWNGLTFGEQQRYGAAECKTKGAIYRTEIAGAVVNVSVNLPASLVGAGFAEKEARWLEGALHKAAEAAIHWILAAREQQKGSHP